MELNHPGAEVIVDENWDTIVHVARLLIERGILSRSELENAIFDPSMEREKSAKQSAAIQTEPLKNWQQARRRWLDRMQSEMALWAELGSKLATTRSAREAFDAYATCAAQQMKMIAEDGQRLLKDFQCVTQKVIQLVKEESSTKETWIAKLTAGLRSWPVRWKVALASIRSYRGAGFLVFIRRAP
jgi:hypothetical protein